MKKLILSIIATAPLLLCQAQTNSSGSVIEAPDFGSLTLSNVVVLTYAIADVNNNDFGAGVGIGYKLTPNLLTVTRFDYIRHEIWKPSVSLQLQTEIKLFGSVKLIPAVYDGVGIALSGTDKGAPVNIVGAGASIPFKQFSWGRLGVMGAYEHWAGNNINEDHYIVGLNVSFQ